MLTTSAVASALLNGTEYRTLRIQELYSSVLGRSADAGGLSFWLGYFAAGNTLESMEANFYGSDEYFNTHGATDAGLVDSGDTELTIILEIVSSPEYYQRA